MAVKGEKHDKDSLASFLQYSTVPSKDVLISHPVIQNL